MPKPKSFALILGVSIMSFLVGYLVFAQVWQEPTAPPPQENVPAPINVGSTAQTKSGNLTIAGDYFYARNLYDLDDTSSWYLNPSGTSRISNVTVTGNLSAPNNSREGCVWTGWLEAGKPSGVYDLDCGATGKLVAGMQWQKHRQEAGDYDWYSFSFLCCSP